MHKATFDIGFWHPFGAHGDETSAKILTRKRREIADNGWTLWCFQYRKPATISDWHKEIACITQRRVVVLCSDSPGAKAPSSRDVDCRYYCESPQVGWSPVPPAIRAIQHIRDGCNFGSAFVVESIEGSLGELPSISWWSKGLWRNDPLPTRGEYLIRTGGAAKLRRTAAVLVLRHPYIVSVAINDPTNVAY